MIDAVHRKEMLMTNPPDQNRSTRQLFAGGATFAAAALLLTSGILTLLMGVSAVVNNQLLVALSCLDATFVAGFKGLA